MTIVGIITLVTLLIAELSCIYLVNHIKKIAENNADILQNRDKEYEAEKGKNLATKEDIAEITKKVEEVKTEVSLSKQQKFDTIIEQKQMLLDLLHDATIITQAQNKLLLYLFDTSSRSRYDSLVETVNDTLAHFYHVSNLAVLTVPLDNIEDVIRDLSVTVTLFGSHINVTATNAANFVEQFNNQMEYAMNKATTDQSKDLWLTSSVNTKRQIEAMRNKANPYKGEMESAVEKYSSWLKKLYGTDFFVFKP